MYFIQMLLFAVGDNNSFYKCRGLVFSVIGIILSFIFQFRYRFFIIFKLLCLFDALCFFIVVFFVFSVRFLIWDLQLNELKYRVIIFRFFVFSDLRNVVFFCFRFVIEILDVNKKKKDMNDVVKVFEGEKEIFKFEIFNCDFLIFFLIKGEEKGN